MLALLYTAPVPQGSVENALAATALLKAGMPKGAAGSPLRGWVCDSLRPEALIH